MTNQPQSTPDTPEFRVNHKEGDSPFELPFKINVFVVRERLGDYGESFLEKRSSYPT